MRAPTLQVPPEVREARRDELISLQQRVGEEWAKSHVGKEVRGACARRTTICLELAAVGHSGNAILPTCLGEPSWPCLSNLPPAH